MIPNAQFLKPRILITNDDGIQAEGLKVLERIAREISDDVWIVAPEQEQSGAGHSLTLHVPVRVRKITSRRYAISGTPTDCVLLALQERQRSGLGQLVATRFMQRLIPKATENGLCLGTLKKAGTMLKGTLRGLGSGTLKKLMGGGSSSATWASNGYIYCLNEDAVTHVVKAGDVFEVAHTNSLDANDMGMSTPALMEDRILLRTASRLYAIGG